MFEGPEVISLPQECSQHLTYNTASLCGVGRGHEGRVWEEITDGARGHTVWVQDGGHSYLSVDPSPEVHWIQELHHWNTGDCRG